MASKTRGAGQGRKNNKRKASEPPSPASSDSSKVITETWVESNAKRVKTEPIDEALSLSTATSATECTEQSLIQDSDDNQDFAHTGGGAITPPNSDGVVPDCSVRESGFNFEASADLLNILSSRDTGTKRFQGRIEEVIEDAFAVIPRSEDEAPGLAYIDYIVEALGRRGAVAERVEEVKQRLMEMWRMHMAGCLGRNIYSASEVQDTVGALVKALPFRPSHNGFSLSPIAVAPALDGNSGSAQADENARSGVTDFAGSETRPKTPALGFKFSVGNGQVISREAKSISAPFEFSDDIVKEDVRSHGRITSGIIPDQDEEANSSKKLKRHSREQFVGPTELFCFHLREAARQASEQTLEAFDEGRCFSHQAVMFYSTLGKHEQNAWARMHRQMRRGDLDPLDGSAPAKLLVDQEIMRRMEKSFIPMRSSDLRSNMPVEAIFIDFVEPSKLDVSRSVMLLVNLPDMPSFNVTKARVVRACSTAFAFRPADVDVEPWSSHIWAATFSPSVNADQLKGKAIVLNGRAVVAEHIHSKAPILFTCDFTDIVARNEEVAYQVARAFAGRKGKIKLEVQECRKLYPGRLFLVSLPRSQKLISFYIPVNIDGTNETFMACFKPVNPRMPCSFCGDKHRPGRTCEHAQEVRLPSVD